MDVDLWVMRFAGDRARTVAAAIIAGAPGCAASFSDSGAMSVLAVSASGSVGADVEQVKERPAVDRIAQRVLSPAERRAIAEAPVPERLVRFYRAWTAAEASAKARGEGLPALLGERSRPALPTTWVEPAPGYVAAVASGEGAPRVRVRELHRA